MIVSMIKNPTPVSAVQWTGDNWKEVAAFGAKVRLDGLGGHELLAGLDGAQGFIPLPVGHWVFGGGNDYWPVADEDVQANYTRVLS